MKRWSVEEHIGPFQEYGKFLVVYTSFDEAIRWEWVVDLDDRKTVAQTLRKIRREVDKWRRAE